MSHFYADIHTARVNEVIRRLSKEIVTEHVPLEAVFAVTPEPVPFSERLGLTYQPIQEGTPWGKTWDCGWFHLQGRIPKAWQGAAVTAQLDFMGETLVFDTDGTPLVGLTSGSVFDGDFSKDMLHLTQACLGHETIDLWVETGSNALFGVNRPEDPMWEENPERHHGYYASAVGKMRLCRFDVDAWQLWLDLTVLINLANALKEGTARKLHILRVCSKALDLLPTCGPAAAREALVPLFALPTDPATVDVTGVGHAHIDTAWLWPVRETIRKCGRTFASQIALIERYPGYCFGASQAQLYAFTKEHYPTLYAKIKQAVAAGRWEVQGGMWVEADCNLISGEAMVRQVLHGKNFFMDEFGVDVKNLWLPDVFGYSGNLPQILTRAGIDYFLTQKLSWNRYNKFPHNTFIWRGIDGSEVLTHFPPTDNYNCNVLPDEMAKNEWNNKEAGLVQEAICLYGIGNGGGGPKEEHVERALRLHNLNGCPRFHFGFTQPVLEKMAMYRDDLDTWSGELYFEFHRGTLTTQAALKRLNRRAEEALRAAEAICAAAGSETYPIAVFDTLWKSVLINQFHDILPGSSIHRVNKETVAQLQGVVSQCGDLARAAADRLLAADDTALTLFNPSSTPFIGMVRLPDGWAGGCQGEGLLTVQREGTSCLARITVPANGFAVLRQGAEAAPVVAEAPAAAAAVCMLENTAVRYTFDGNLQLTGAFDKETGREIIAAGDAGNRLELFDDHPHSYDAWDIDEYYRTMRVDTAKVEGEVTRIDGPARSGLRATLRIGQSLMRQTVWLEAEGKRLDFVNEVEWDERHKLLRVAFPTTIIANEAKFEIQYGHVARATHDNTKWQYAQFEAVGHRWADLSERDYGVALLNDSKYGYRIKGASLELSLLRAPTAPDPVADLGPHAFTYSFLPHCGDFAASDVRDHAAILNQGLSCFAGYAAAAKTALPVSVAGEGVELAVLKRAEKSDCLVIRVVETRGVVTEARVRARDTKQRFVETDLLEWKDGARSPGADITVTLKPFEIRTWKMV